MENTDINNARIARGLELPLEKKLYFNGFVVSMTAGDIVIVLEANGEPVAVVNASHILGKALGETLVHTLGNFERDTYPIHTLKELEEKIQALNAKTD